MNWFYTISIFVIVVVISAIFFIFTPKPQVFFDCNISELEILKNNHSDIEEEIEGIDSNHSVIPIYGNDEIKNINFPKTYNILRCIPDIKYAGIIILKPKFEQKKQYGYAVNADKTLRYFYCIKQSAMQKSGIWIDGETKFFNEQDVICGDMSREHSLFNKHKNDTTYILFIDIERPSNINNGRSICFNIEDDEIIYAFS